MYRSYKYKQFIDSRSGLHPLQPHPPPVVHNTTTKTWLFKTNTVSPILKWLYFKNKFF